MAAHFYFKTVPKKRVFREVLSPPTDSVSSKIEIKNFSIEAKRLNVGATTTADFVSYATAHMFKATASNATSTVKIKVTDRFGNTYSETMNRPKSLSCSMK
ncbi:calcineurin-like phosphoesterase C-terminal domain-containing protein [Barnesiella intestinihominis]|uniref:calcineurin-like phosphoesterase C-terminal domain-containing protein n=1 Tax=Barnesiella intestinihominis TaxID=487174 RepID=UPI001E3352E9|nr:calcineurin-like phosphoesterase C-terminal domain-containing protein [Barnesiella intestinihominis]MDB0671803.1 calcineurin-like phosphoesterase C-terminal domain-containing protein [Barnesiella intestinihominis]